MSEMMDLHRGPIHTNLTSQEWNAGYQSKGVGLLLGSVAWPLDQEV